MKNLTRIAAIGTVWLLGVVHLEAQITSWQWLNPLPQGNSLNAVQMLDENTIVAVGDAGTILRSTNGGATWQVSYHVNGATLLSAVSFIDANSGWAVGGGGTIIRTANGGATWTSQLSGTTNYLAGVSFTDANRGTAVGSNGMILRTTTGGVSWTSQSSGTANHLRGVFFTDANTGTAVGEGGTILRTTNGGSNWTSQSSGTSNHLYSVSFTDANTGTAVGGIGPSAAGVVTILRTTNGGANWTAQSIGSSIWSNILLDGVSFIDANTGWAVGSGTDALATYGHGLIFHTTNGGATWTGQDSATTKALSGVSFTDANTGTAVGPFGTTMHTTNGGTTWTTRYDGTTNDLFGVSFADVNTVTAVGYNGTIVRTTNGGASWISQTSGTTSLLHGTAFTDANSGWAVGGEYNQFSGWSSVILHTTDGGANWASQSSGTPWALLAVSFTDSTTGSAVGEGGAIQRTTDGGANWSTQTSGTASALRGVSFSDANAGWAVGSGGIIVRTSNGGTSWTTQSSGTTNTLRGVSFTDANTGTAVGDSGTILRTTNGGASWTIQTSGTKNSLWSVSFTDANTGAVVGDANPSRATAILFTTNGGANWTSQSSGTENDLNGISHAQTNSGGSLWFGVGRGGTILCASSSPLNLKTWTGSNDSSWNTPGNWSPPGIPSLGDSVIIAPGIRPCVVMQQQQQITIASLLIPSSGDLIITDSLSRFVVKGDVVVHGTFELRPPAQTTIVVGGNWIIDPGGSAARFRKNEAVAEEGFFPAYSTVYLKGSGVFSHNFFNLVFDTSSSMQSTGNVLVENQCTILKEVNLRAGDTLTLQSGEPQALTGFGNIVRGTILRALQPASVEHYRFENDSTYIRFDGIGTYPTGISETVFPDTDATTIVTPWVVISSHIDTLTNTIVANTVTHFSKWALGIPRPHASQNGPPVPIIRRFFEINAEGGTAWRARLALHYQQSEIPPGEYEDSLVLLTDAPAPLEHQMEEGWNLASVPIIVDDYRKASLFPDAVSNAFSYAGSYQARDTLQAGVGFWIKYPAPTLVPFRGISTARETVDVADKWNIIGTPTFPVRAANITTLPPATRLSEFFGYTSATGYFTEDTLNPGDGFWVKMNNSGKLVLDTGSAINRAVVFNGTEGKEFDTLIIRDAEKRRRTLYFSSQPGTIDLSRYELPPIPPEGMDVRYASNRYLEMADPHEAKTTRLEFSSVVYPIELEWKFAVHGGTAKLIVDAKEISIQGRGLLRIATPGAKVSLRLVSGLLGELPGIFALHQNYPNPFNPITTIRFDLPEPSRVVLKVYNMLGQEVATLVDGEMDAGFQQAELDATTLASGVYYYRISATSRGAEKVYQSGRKMLLLR